jgi:RNA recognition motif-containing protein
MEIFVGNLPGQMDREQLAELFRPYGEVSVARVIVDKFSGLSRGFGFVHMPDDDQAMEGIRALNGREVQGNRIQVEESRTRSRRVR